MSLDFDEFLKGLWGKSDSNKHNWVKWVHRNLSENHCPECLALDGCLFAGDNHPRYPHHQFCHCSLKEIPKSEVESKATVYADYRKFDPYLFNTEGKETHNKEKLFKSWGYDSTDSSWLKQEIEKQGLKKYISGDYKLGLLNKYGQRISIRIEIPNKNTNDIISFVAGFMVWPNGEIRLITPYGGK